MSKIIASIDFELGSPTLSFDLGTITGGRLLPDYTGEYRIIPKVTEQTLDTRDKSLRDDMVVSEIPLTKVSNPKGGKTAIIG